MPSQLIGLDDTMVAIVFGEAGMPEHDTGVLTSGTYMAFYGTSSLVLLREEADQTEWDERVYAAWKYLRTLKDFQGAGDAPPWRELPPLTGDGQWIFLDRQLVAVRSLFPLDGVQPQCLASPGINAVNVGAYAILLGSGQGIRPTDSEFDAGLTSALDALDCFSIVRKGIPPCTTV